MANLNKVESANQEKPRDRSNVRFLFLAHHDRLLDADDPLFTTLDDRDILLIELLGSSQERQEHVYVLNNILADPNTLPSLEQQVRLDLIAQNDPNFYTQIAIHYAGTNKRIHAVDIDDTHPAFSRLYLLGRANASIIESVTNGDLEMAINQYEEFMELWNEICIIREEAVANQVENIVSTLPLSTKVAVVQGAAHVQTAQLYRQTGAAGFDTVTYPELSSILQVWQKKRLGQNIDHVDLLRAFITEYLLLPTTDDNRYDQVLFDQIGQISNNLTDNQVVAATELFRTLYKSNLRRLIPSRLRNDPTIKKNYAPFAYRAAIKELLQSLKSWLKK